MNALVLIGLALVAAGLVLLGVRFAPRVRRQFAATAAQPRTVADLVRLRTEAGTLGGTPPPSPATPDGPVATASGARAAAAPGRTVASPPAPAPAACAVPPVRPGAARPAPPAPPSRVPVRTEPAPVDPPAPAFEAAPAPAAAAPVPGGPHGEPEPAGPPPPRLDGDDAPWQRGARMAAGLGGGQPWQEPPAPAAPLRIVPSPEAPAGSAAPVEYASPIHPAAPAPEDAAEPDAPAGYASVRLVAAEPAAEADVPAAATPDAGLPDDLAAQSQVRLVPAEPAPEVAIGAQTGDAVPDRFADERAAGSEGPAAATGEPAAGRRSRQTPDELAAEQAAVDLALLRTFGFADPGLRPDSAPVVAMVRPEAKEPAAGVGEAQPVRYRVIRRDGSVVGGATVNLLDDRGGDVAVGTADAEGRGELLAPTPGGYVLVSTAAGHQPGAVAITVGGPSTEADVLLARSASVSGSVHGEDGPIAGARVTLAQDGEAVDVVDTDSDGTYRISDISAGEFGLSVAAAGCEPVATLLDVAEEADVHHDVELTPASPVADADGDRIGDDAMSGRR
jgi:Carboxypeptidase regulatory-like domain